MYWLIFSLASSVLAFFCPYIGLFGTFNIAATIILFCFDLCTTAIYKDKTVYRADVKSKKCKITTILFIVVALIMSGIAIFVNICVSTIASGILTGVAKNLSILSSVSPTYGIIAYVITLLLQITSTVLIVFRYLHFKALQKELEKSVT